MPPSSYSTLMLEVVEDAIDQGEEVEALGEESCTSKRPEASRYRKEG